VIRRAGRAACAAALICGLLLIVGRVRAFETLPAQLSDQEFWQLSSSLSEPDGFFHSDNFVSNERSFQTVLAELSEGRQPGSAYIGVGPEQNFTYLLAVKPKIAFVLDIRRQNLIEHLMYKALFELSADRAEFLSRLLSRGRPAAVVQKSSVEDLFVAFNAIAVDDQLFQDNLQAIRDHLIKVHRFPLSREDQFNLERIFRAFTAGGGNLTYDGPIPVRGVRTTTGFMPTFEELMLATDREGRHQSFLATEENYQWIRRLQEKNLVVPVVGNFAGPYALRAVGQYLRDHDATVTSFYTSNVEQYLFGDGTWSGFYANVATLPVNRNSVIVRGLIRSASGDLSSSPQLPPTSHYETGLFPIEALAREFNAGNVRVYEDVLRVK
jgi:hypothetical protein